jgi:hypothetical protein
MPWRRVRKIEARSKEHAAIIERWGNYFALDLERPAPIL